jgi:hypothetical protein
VQPIIYEGTGQAPPEQVFLRAGALSAVYEAGMLRYVRLGEREILRAVYAAVRDQNWRTIPALLRDVTMQVGADSFEITFTAEHQQGAVHFVWQGSISGSADGTIRFTFDGAALSSFRRNRVGFCILHPMSLAGQPVELEHTNGTTEQNAFPDAIMPHQPFFDLRAMTHAVADGVRARVEMTGDTFETEDQRNWSDASYKTYCTPIAQPYPAPIEAGTKIQQAVTLRLLGKAGQAMAGTSVAVLMLGTTAHQLPTLGLGCASDGVALTGKEIERLKALHLTHLRVDVKVDAQLEDKLRQAWAEANVVGCALELAVTLGSDLEGELARLRAVVDDVQAQIARWLIFRVGEGSTSRATIEAARRVLGDDAPLGAGTDGYFTQLNRERPAAEILDWMCYSLNPQVHAVDNGTLTENLPTQGVQVASARAFANGAKIAVSPVTLKMRSNIDATEAVSEIAADTLPANVDVRQLSLFGAGWALGSIKSLAVADSVTYFETAGWRGVMERTGGSPQPELFPSTAGGVYPMYHVFADVGEFAGGEVLTLVSSDALRFDGLALRKAGRLRILLANYTHERQTVRLRGVSGRFVLKILDETTAAQAIAVPEAFRAAAGVDVKADDAGLRLELLPYACVRLDQHEF